MITATLGRSCRACAVKRRFLATQSVHAGWRYHHSAHYPLTHAPGRPRATWEDVAGKGPWWRQVGGRVDGEAIRRVARRDAKIERFGGVVICRAWVTGIDGAHLICVG